MKNVYTKMMALACMFLLGTNAWADTHTIVWNDASASGNYTHLTSSNGTITVGGDIIVSVSTVGGSYNSKYYHSDYSKGCLYLEKGDYFTLTPGWGVTITGFELVSDKFPLLNYEADGGSAVTIANNNTKSRSVTGLSARSSLKIKNYAANGQTSNLYLKYITITYTKESWTNTTTTIDATGITNTDVNAGLNAGSLAATVTPGNGSVTWTSSNTAVATIDANTGAVTLVREGEVTFTATYAGVWGQYNPSSATYTMNVTDSTPQPGTWEEVALGDLSTSDVFVIVGTVNGKTYALPHDGGTNKDPSAVAVTVVGNKILSHVTDNLKWNTNSSKNMFYPNGTTSSWLYNTKETVRVGNAQISSSTSTYRNYQMDGSYLKSKNGDRWLSISSSIWKMPTSQTTTIKFYKFVLDTTPIDISVSAAGFSSLYYGEVNLEVPAGVEAYTYVIDGGKLEVNTTYSEGDQIPAGEAVVIKGSAGNYSFAVKAPTSNCDASNVLKGTDHKAMTEGGTYYYALSLNANNDPSSVGFYWMKSDGSAFVNGAHKAYLALDQTFAELAGTTVKAFILPSEDDATGIEGVQEVQEDQGAIYNLAGQRLQKMQKGINIVNGKKILF